MALKHMVVTPRCHAFSKTTGKRCGQPAIRGGTVCVVHGGSSPAAKAEAQRRIATMIDPALEVMYNLLVSPKTPPATRVVIARDLLDRAGLQAVTKTQDVPWDGDPSSVKEEVLDRFIFNLERLAWGEDRARIEQEKRKVLSEAGSLVVDVESEPDVTVPPQD